MHTRRVTVRGIILDDGKVFAQQLHGTIAKGGDWWCTPGGGIDDGENLRDALYREMIEETGIKPVIGNLLFIQQYAESPDKELLEFFFHITNTEDYHSVDLSQTSHGELEIAQFGFVDPKKVNLLPAELQEIDIASHIRESSPVTLIAHL